MRPLFSQVGRQCLRSLVQSRSLYAFDFDGTLTRITPHRQAVCLTRQVCESLRELSHWAPTVIISGRSVRDLRRRVGGSVSYLIGNHGVEGLHTPATVLRRARRGCAMWRRTLVGASAQALRRVGVEVENKTYSLAFHYRRALHAGRARRMINTILARLKPEPRIVLGKKVVNVIPPQTPNKGQALMQLMARLGVEKAVFVGDDRTDEDVFVLADPRIVTVRVGRSRRSRAKFFLKKQSEVVRLLRELVSLYRERSRCEPAGQRVAR